MTQPGKRDWVAETFGKAVTDIREKLVEEPWFGKAVTADHAQQPAKPRSMAEAMGWTVGDQTRTQEPHRSHDLDVER